MSQLTKQQVDDLIDQLKDPKDARDFLVNAGLIDVNGVLTKAYQFDSMSNQRPANGDLIRYCKDHPNNPLDLLTPDQAHSLLNLIADVIEQRGEIDYDRDPGETADWLRREADLIDPPKPYNTTLSDEQIYQALKTSMPELLQDWGLDNRYSPEDAKTFIKEGYDHNKVLGDMRQSIIDKLEDGYSKRIDELRHFIGLIQVQLSNLTFDDPDIS
jgi:hypothetical protein